MASPELKKHKGERHRPELGRILVLHDAKKETLAHTEAYIQWQQTMSKINRTHHLEKGVDSKQISH